MSALIGGRGVARSASARSARHAIAAWVQRRGMAPGVLALAALNAFLWWPYLLAPLHIDVAGYSLAAYWWARGDTLYEELSITRPQGIFVIFRVLQAVGLGEPWGIHLAGAAICALSAAVLWWIVGRAWGKGSGLAAASIFSVLMTVPVLEGGTVNAEIFMLLPLLGSVAAVLRADDDGVARRTRLVLLALSGSLGAVALLVKPAGVAAIPFAAIWILRRWWYDRKPWASVSGDLAALLIGFGVGLSPAIVHGLVTAPDRYLYDVFLYRVGQDSAVTNGLSDQFTSLFWNTAHIVVHLPLVVLGGVGLWASRRATAVQRDLLALWMATSLGGVALGGNWFPHYFQQLLPPLAVAIVLGVQSLLRPIGSRRQAALQCFAAISVVQIVVTIAMSHWPSTGDDWLFPQSKIELYTPTTVSAPLVAYIQEHTSPYDRVYVASYAHPDLYYSFRRRPSARWIYIRELERNPGAFAEQIALIADPTTAPVFIIATPHSDYGIDTRDDFRAVVARDYRLETTIGDFSLYRRSEPPTPAHGAQGR